MDIFGETESQMFHMLTVGGLSVSGTDNTFCVIIMLNITNVHYCCIIGPVTNDYSKKACFNAHTECFKTDLKKNVESSFKFVLFSERL